MKIVLKKSNGEKFVLYEDSETPFNIDNRFQLEIDGHIYHDCLLHNYNIEPLKPKYDKNIGMCYFETRRNLDMGFVVNDINPNIFNQVNDSFKSEKDE